MRIVITVWLVFAAATISSAPSYGNTRGKSESADARLAQLIEANVIAVHAFQVLLAKSSGKGDKSCFSPGRVSDAELRALSDHQASLFKSDLTALRAWVKGEQSAFDRTKDLDPILKSGLEVPIKAPVNVFTRYLSENTKASDVK